MLGVKTVLERVAGLDLERRLGLRPNYPPLALQLERDAISLVRLKLQRGKPPLLEAARSASIEGGPCVPSSIFDSVEVPMNELVDKLKSLFESTGTRPGRVSLVIPDNLAKVTLLTLPEMPASPKQLDQLVRAQMRRAIPFRLDDSRMAYQVLPSEGRQVGVLVVLVRASLIQQYETALAAVGARVGLVDLCTPNLINLCRASFDEAAKAGEDSALLNCDQSYFSLAILRRKQLIFFRCKTFALGDEESSGPNGVLVREIANSFSYYREKLDGAGVSTLFLRSIYQAQEEIASKLGQLGLEKLHLIDPSSGVERGASVEFDRSSGQHLAPAIGAAIGRGR